MTLPGMTAFDDELARRLGDALQAKRGQGYAPRTRHLNPDGSPKYTNRLLLESSPYLLQHAHNPVSWHAWANEAFDAAREQRRPVLLSVGYSTCHWCHVMEEESFEDEEIARLINERYIAIKVDREERPDVDAVYMNAVQAMTGRGGWPMTVWLTPDRKPFFGGTYYPARDGDRGAATGFLTLLDHLWRVYEYQSERVADAAARIVPAVQEQLSATSSPRESPNVSQFEQAADFYARRFDGTRGGLASAPKFPSSLPIRWLLRHHRRTGDEKSLRMSTLTLEKMMGGGIYDHVGGGFHRYSTDADWLVPHFEKMLYDNALLTVAYLEAYQVTGREVFARVVVEILRYVAREMTAPEGGFFSATDADSLTPAGDRKEGWFFTWTLDELRETLGEERARFVERFYGASDVGNFEGRNILHAPRPLSVVAAEVGMPLEKAQRLVEEARKALYAERSRRPLPLRDEKVLAAWNGLMISAFARAAIVLGIQEYAARAARAMDFVLTSMRRNGRLLRSFKDGVARHNAYLDDYAFLIAGLLDLLEATGERRWLEEAMALDGVLADSFEDQQYGGFFMTSDDHEPLLIREKPAHDGAEPSGNSIQALNLLRLHVLTDQEGYRNRAILSLKAFSGILTEAPTALSEMLLAMDFHLDAPKQVVIVVPRAREEAEPFLRKLRVSFVPNRTVVVLRENEIDAWVSLVPWVEHKSILNGRPTAYVCENRICRLPTNNPEEFGRQIGGSSTFYSDQLKRDLS